jgi:hypothetical protein
MEGIDYEDVKYLDEFIGLWEIISYDEGLIKKYTLVEKALSEYGKINHQTWIQNHKDTYFCELIPGYSSAEVICEIKFRFKDNSRIYESKELYLVNKFTDLYSKLIE